VLFAKERIILQDLHLSANNNEVVSYFTLGGALFV